MPKTTQVLSEPLDPPQEDADRVDVGRHEEVLARRKRQRRRRPIEAHPLDEATRRDVEHADAAIE